MGSVGTSSNKATKNEWLYHGTSASNLIGIYRNGLQMSSRGMVGKGVYLAYDEQSANDWGQEQNKTTNTHIKVLRVSSAYLQSQGNKYEQVDDEQAVFKSKIPTKYIEIKNTHGMWESLDTYAHRYYRSFGISK